MSMRSHRDTFDHGTCDFDAGVVDSDRVDSAADGHKADVVMVVSLWFNLGRDRPSIQTDVDRQLAATAGASA